DLLAYFRAAVNLKDEEALKRIINYPKRGIGDTTLQKIIDYANAADITLFDALKSVENKGRSGTTIHAFIHMMERFHQKAANLDAYETAVIIAKESGIMAELNKDNTIEGMSRKENTIALLDGIKEFTEEDVLAEDQDEISNKSMATYLQNVA